MYTGARRKCCPSSVPRHRYHRVSENLLLHHVFRIEPPIHPTLQLAACLDNGGVCFTVYGARWESCKKKLPTPLPHFCFADHGHWTVAKGLVDLTFTGNLVFQCNVYKEPFWGGKRAVFLQGSLLWVSNTKVRHHVDTLKCPPLPQWHAMLHVLSEVWHADSGTLGM